MVGKLLTSGRHPQNLLRYFFEKLMMVKITLSTYQHCIWVFSEKRRLQNEARYGQHCHEAYGK